ncbi:MAG: NAD(P)/FAD-dependent oxidoreductase [Candidatus Sericytochromatia bacterium]|nr:NAD(P)/FAD-dependent oxidoreductase [Candidatus Sericytochromatia bacterium]
MSKHLIPPVVVAGGGAAGMMAAIAAAESGAPVTLLEKTGRLGFKIRISGGGRCNITNALSEPNALITMYPGHGRFLRDALRQYPPAKILDLLHRHGVATKVEAPYDKIFPVSDQSQDVIAALEAEMRQLGVVVRLNTAVRGIHLPDDRAAGFRLADGGLSHAGAVVLCTGGKSLPRSGSTGDGYPMVEALGHQVTPLFPSLVPLKVAGLQSLAGVALRNVEGSVWVGGKQADRPWRGDLLFTHTGLSGPIVLQLSRAAAAAVDAGQQAQIRINLLPDLDQAAVDQMLQAVWQDRGRQQLSSVLHDWLPKSVVPVFLALAELPGDRKIAELGRPARLTLLQRLRGWPFDVTGWQSFDIAEVTAGGVALTEVNAKTMASKIVAGLYFAGEILDVDGYVGGYNFQAAWSTGHVAGKQAAAYVKALSESAP